MTYLPITLRVDNFPQINFRKIAANRNKKLYLFLNVVKGICALFTKKPDGRHKSTGWRRIKGVQ